MNRRSVIKGAMGFGLLAGEALSGRFPLAFAIQSASKGGVFDPRRFGARGDGSTKDTTAIQQTIDACSGSGGGTVLLSPGTYLTGTVILKDNVNLHLQQGATLLGSTYSPDYYIPVDAQQAVKATRGFHLVFAFHAHNISITGAGTIDGQSNKLMVRNGRPDPAPEDMWKEVAGWNWKLTNFYSPMVELAECTNVLVEDVTMQNAAGWTFRPVGCDTVTIRGIRIRNPIYTPNGDGIDPSCCQNVLITDCDISTGDDAICVKSFNPYGENKTSRNIVVTNCVLNTCCNGFKVGVEGPGGFENISFTNSRVVSLSAPLNERVIAGIAIEMTDNGWINGVSVSNITMNNVRAPIFIRLQNSYKDKSAVMSGRLRGVKISGVQATGAIVCSSITGLEGFPVQDVSLENIRISSAQPGRAEWTMNHIAEQEHGYPEAHMFGRLPAFGLYCRHATSIQLRDVHFHSEPGDPRPFLACEDVNGLSLTDVDATGTAGAQYLISLKNTQNVTVQGCSVREGVGVFAEISGAQSKQIVFRGNDLRRAKLPVQIGQDVPATMVQMDAGHPVS